MRVARFFVLVILFLSVSIPGLALQSGAGQETPEDHAFAPARSSAQATLPRTMRFGGVVRAGDGAPRTGAVALTFSLYPEAQGGTPLWLETQNVTLDEQGRYTVLLGYTARRGLPIRVFASGEARWLGVRVAEEGAAEQPRIQLVSVPYALAAADAHSLGGRPAADFQLTRQAMGTAVDASEPGLEPTAPISNGAQDGIPNRIARFDGAATIAPSALIFDNGSNVGIGTVTPTALFHVSAVAGDAFNLYTSTTAGGSVAVYANHFGAAPIGYAGFFTKTGAGTTNIGLYAEASGATNNYAAIFQGGNVGIGTGGPSQKLQVAGTIYSTAGGFKFPDGTVQTTAATTGGGSGVTIIDAGQGLVATPNPITATGTLSANLTSAGGDSGSAATVARGDHLHDARYVRISPQSFTYSNASVNGRYAFTEFGAFTDNGVYVFSGYGTVQTNGSGQITSGTLTESSSYGYTCTFSLSGSYSVGSTGSGSVSLTATAGTGGCPTSNSTFSIQVTQQGASLLLSEASAGSWNSVVALKQ